MGADHSDSGAPMQGEVVATPKVEYHKFKTTTRQVSIRNVGVNTLWMSFDKENWHDVACGTSYDERVRVDGFWYCTQTGRTHFVVIGLMLNVFAER